VALVDLDAALSADSSVTAGAVVAWALAATPSADSVFASPMLLATRAFASGVLADSVFSNPMLRRARPMAAPVVADSSSTDAAQMAFALAATPSADSLGSGFIGLARPIAATPSADSVFGPSFMNSTDGMLTFVLANSQVAADLTNIVPLAASLTAGSFLAGGPPDIYRLPPPNRPQPLPPTTTPPLRAVPSSPGPPSMGIGAARPRQRGL